MKKISALFVVLVFTASTAFGSVLGPKLITKGKGKGKAQPERFSFSASVSEGDNATLHLTQWQGAKVSAVVELNGEELVNRKTKFLDGELELPVTLIDGDNVLVVTALGKKGVSLTVEVTKTSSTLVTVYSAVVTETDMVPGADVRLTLLDGTVRETISGEDGFCIFEDVPAIGAVLLEAVTLDGRVSSAAVALKSSEDPIAVELPSVAVPGPGIVTGSILTDEGLPLKVAVSLVFSKTKYSAATMTEEDGTFVFEGLPLDGYYFISVKGSGQLRAGTGRGQLTEEQPADTTDVAREVVCRRNGLLLNGDFEQNTFGWRGTGQYGVMGSLNYFFGDDSDEKCKTPLSGAGTRTG